MVKMKTAVKVASYILATCWVLFVRIDIDHVQMLAGAMEGWSLKDSLMKYVSKNHTPCCRDYFAQFEAGNTYSDGSIRLPPSCMAEEASCPKFNIFAGVHVPAEKVDGEWLSMVCTDREGRTRENANADADILDYTGGALPFCDDLATMTPGDDRWWWFSRAEFVFYILSVASMFYTATLPLMYADEGYRVFETMAYDRRVMATSALWFISGGGCFLYISTEIHALHWIWITRGTWTCMFLVVMFLLYTFLFMRPLPFRNPAKEAFDNCIFAVLREYFDLRVVNEFAMDAAEKEKKKNSKSKKKANKNNTYLLALMPHAVMPYGAMLGASVLPVMLPDVWPVSGVVATALMSTPVLRHLINYLGVREAGTASILQMFLDRFQAVAVVTGGVAEMFVRSDKEVLARIRRGFGRIAITGGHDIIPIFTFGVSHTHSVCPGFNNGFFRRLSRKATMPLFPFYGACGLIPRRQQLKMVIGRPIEVEQVTEGVTDKDAEAVCKKVQTKVIDIYERHRPFWEQRPIEYIR